MKVGYKILEMLQNIDVVYDWCDDYGEPGYTKDKEDGVIIFGDIWCDGKHRGKRERCKHEDRWSREGKTKLHSIEVHYPRLFAAMEEQGIEFQWHDEWIVQHEESKAYRVQADSYQWESSILWTDGDFLTPEDDIELWIDEVVNNPRKCLPSHVWSNEQIEEQGFEEHECGFRNGWFDGMNDDPVKISEEIRRREGEDVDILFKLSFASQFHIGFCVFVRNNKEEEDGDEA